MYPECFHRFPGTLAPSERSIVTTMDCSTLPRFDKVIRHATFAGRACSSPLFSVVDAPRKRLSPCLFVGGVTSRGGPATAISWVPSGLVISQVRSGTGTTLSAHSLRPLTFIMCRSRAWSKFPKGKRYRSCNST